MIDQLLSLWAVTWRVALFFTLWGVLLAGPVVLVSQRAPALVAAYPRQSRLYFELVTVVTIVAAAWVMVRLVDGRDPATLGFASANPLRDLARGALVAIAWLGLCLAVLWTFGLIAPRGSLQVGASALAWAAVPLFLNTVSQEVLARSYVFQTIQAHTNTVWAIGASSLLFAAYHAGGFNGSWLAAMNVFLAGILFAFAYVAAGNLWVPIGLHFVWNLLVGPVLGLTVSGRDSLVVGAPAFEFHGPDVLTGGSFGLEASVVVTVATLAIAAGIALVARPA